MTVLANTQEATGYSLMSGEVYDLIYSRKDYKGGAEGFADIIKKYSKSGGGSVLEVACGTGTYMQYLSEHFTVDGFDLSREQVDAAKKKLPKSRIIQADMLDFDMGEQYDGVLCVFSSIGHMSTKAELSKAIANIAEHTKPGGAVIIEPWYRKENFKQGEWLSFEIAASEGDLSVACMCLVSSEENHTHLEFHHMVGRPKSIDHFVEKHTMTMFTEAEFSDAFKKAGLEMEYDPVGPSGRGLYMGMKPF